MNKITPSHRSVPQTTPGNAASGREITIGMVTNPRSGGNRRGIDEVRRFLAKNPGIEHSEAVTPSEVNKVLAGFSARNVDLIIVNGGDGTVQAVLTAIYGQALFTRPPLLALLRAGTTSMLARDVGVSGELHAALAKILAWSIDTGRNESRIQERPVLSVRQEADSEPICGMFFGAGAIPLGIDICHGSMNRNGMRGELMPGVIIARLLLAVLTGNEKLIPGTDMGIRLDETPVRRSSCLFAMVTTLERLFLGLHPFWGREAAPLRFTALKTKPPYFLRNLPFLLWGRRTKTATPENGFFSHNVRRITLDFSGSFTLDGELFDARTPLTIEPAGPARFLSI